jgi:methionyl-tRNA synthetase
MPSPRKKFYITTSIVYTNAFPHIGFAFESVQADVIARYHRLLGKETFFLTGTDEHGTKVAKAAEQNQKNPKEFVDEISKKVRALRGILNLSNDDFIRTTDQKRHWPAVKKVWLKLKENGDIYKKKYRGLYCSGCEAFITKKDLKEGKCIIHQVKPEIIEEENYFFRLSRYSKKIKKIIEKNIIKIIPETRKNENLSFVKKGLEDISFSRPRKDLKWGIPVPDDRKHTVYVWGDALVNYISALSYVKNSKKFQKFWPADVHCIGKDIQKFHCLIWPGIILSLELPLPKTIFVHGFISVEGQKMSKSLGNIVDPFELVKKYGTDPVRYFLLREIPSTEDGDFTYEKFEARYNSDLASGLGNLVARILTLAEKTSYELRIRPNYEFENKINKTLDAYKKFLDEFKFNETLISVWELIGFCDKYIEKEKPWESKNQRVLYELLFALANIAQLLQPFLPETSEKIFQQLGIKPADRERAFKPKKGKQLFPKLGP